ncbi:MAG: GlsB/YeaQ/YmgE family stress response membrane protein [Ottowia sp.]|nr:GlsB/YeaQ/YmgE family stress response membrane protein [Ottowia sp.]
MSLFSILGAIIVGFIVGLIARAIMPGTQKMGIIMTSVLGIAGSMAAFYSAGMLGLTGPVGFIGSVIGAIVLLFLYEIIRKNMR